MRKSDEDQLLFNLCRYSNSTTYLFHYVEYNIPHTHVEHEYPSIVCLFVHYFLFFLKPNFVLLEKVRRNLVKRCFRIPICMYSNSGCMISLHVSPTCVIDFSICFTLREKKYCNVKQMLFNSHWFYIPPQPSSQMKQGAYT